MELSVRNQWLIGAFVLGGLIIVLFSIFMLGADRALFKRYGHLRVRFDQVQGLNNGSIVSLSGMTIGNAHRITFLPEHNVMEIEMKIEYSFMSLLAKGTQVEIRTQGALGDKFLFLIPGPHSNEKVSEGDLLEVAKPTDLLGIISERGRETEKVFDLLNEVYKTALTLNSGKKLESGLQNFSEASLHIKEASLHLQKISQNLSGELQNEKGILPHLKSSLVKMDNILDKIDKGQGTLGSLINDPSLHTQLKSYLGTSQRRDGFKNVIRTSIENSKN